MKKTLAILLAVVMLFALAAPVMAAKSPAAGKVITVVLKENDDATPQKQTVTVSDDIEDGTMTLTYTAKETFKQAKFAAWVLQLPDGTIAKLGIHYTLAGGTSLTDLTVKIIPLTDLIVKANYGDKDTDIKDAQALFQDKSEPTGDTLAVFAIVMFVALAGTVVCKKQLAK